MQYALGWEGSMAYLDNCEKTRVIQAQPSVQSVVALRLGSLVQSSPHNTLTALEGV